MGTKAKKSGCLKALGILLALVLLGAFLLYQFIQSPRFLQFVMGRLNQSLSGDILYDSFSLDLNQRHLQIRGMVYQNAAGLKIVSLKALDLDFAYSSALKGNFGITKLRADGLTIDQRNSPKSLKPSSWRTALRIVLKRLSIQDAVVKNIALYLRNGDEFRFGEANVGLSSQSRAQQEVSFWVTDALLRPADTEIRTGRLVFTGKITLPVVRDFTFFVSEAEGSLKLEDVQVGSLPASSFLSEVKIGGDVLYLENGRFLLPDGTLLVDVDYLPEKATYKLDLKTAQPMPFSAIPRAGKELLETFDQFELGLYAELSGYKLSTMTGKVKLDFKAIGNTANPQAPENKLHLEGTMKNGSLSLDVFKLSSAKSEVDGSGTVDFPKQRFDVKIKTKAFDLATMIQALSDLDLRGYADAEGTITGAFKNPSLNFKAHGKELAYSFLHFGEHVGNFGINDNLMTYEGEAPASQGHSAKVTVRGENFFKKNRHVVLKTQFKGLDATKLLDNPDILGKVEGTFDLDAVSGQSPTGVLHAEIPGFQLLDFKLGTLTADGKLGSRRFVIAPLTFQPPNYDKITMPGEAVFEFDDKGVKVKGEALPGLSFTGRYTYDARPKKFFIDADAKNVDLRAIWAAMEFPMVESYADGKIKMAIGIQGAPTEIDINASRFVIPLEEGGEIAAAEPVKISIRPPRMIFEKASFHSGGGRMDLSGTYQFDGPMNLQLKGRANLALLAYWKSFFRSAEGFANVDLKASGKLENPQVTGEVNFSEAALSLRPVRANIENLSGKIKSNGRTISFEELKGTVAEGDITINGRVEVGEKFEPRYADLTINTREIAVSEPEVYKLVLSGDFTLKGPGDSILLAGDMFITEGRYVRDFNISQFIMKPQAKTLPAEPNPWLNRIRLDLKVKSPGELAIKNNIAEMYLSTDLEVKGPAAAPVVQGEIQVLDGSFHYFKIAFDNARGYVDFRGPRTQPYVDITATKEVLRNFATVNVTANIIGYLDNLQLNFTSDSGLSKRDVLSMVFTGGAPGGSQVSNASLASSVIAGQIAGYLQRPLAERASLDIFRLESNDDYNARRRDRQGVTTLVVGKKLTERFMLEFKTDLGVDEPLQGVQMEYILLDNALVKASQLSDGSFDFDFTLRWRTF
ncbi:MAG TPA: translocation/assembly module TamB domain-containing protein [bacterium]|nr:translocation/assembly module TamB domain-containing protein [bacterium]